MKLFDALRTWGADVDGGMERLYADDDFFLKCLKMMEADENFQKLDVAMNAKDYEEAFNAVHTLKGVAGNLSLDPLYKSLCVLTEKLRAHDYQNLEAPYADVKQREQEFKTLMKTEG